MGRTTHLHLSSCGQTPKLLDIPVGKRVQFFFSLPRIKCEKVSHSCKRRLSPSPSSSWSYFEVYGNGLGFVSTSEGKEEAAGSSRVLAAWKKIQSWSPGKPKKEAMSCERPTLDHSHGQAAATRRLQVRISLPFCY